MFSVQFFLKATQLEQMNNDYVTIKEQQKIMSHTLEKKKEVLLNYIDGFQKQFATIVVSTIASTSVETRCIYICDCNKYNRFRTKSLIIIYYQYKVLQEILLVTENFPMIIETLFWPVMPLLHDLPVLHQQT